MWENKDPPKKYKTILAHNATILEYSAIKMKLNNTPGYSVFYPAINSASASHKSNGALLVSAVPVNINIKSKVYKALTL